MAETEDPTTMEDLYYKIRNYFLNLWPWQGRLDY
jgi:hypothetical protein